MSQSSCCCGGSEFMDAAYCYREPYGCRKTGCSASPYTASALSRDVEACACSGCGHAPTACCCPLPSWKDSSEAASEEQGCEGMACKKESCAPSTRLCCDRDGSCCLYPARCRDGFWPEFSHPRWLCCKDLYSGENHYDSCCQEDCSCQQSSEDR